MPYMNEVGFDINNMRRKRRFKVIKTYNDEAMAQGQVINFSYRLTELTKKTYLQI